MDRDLFTAILSMDAYHRGYNSGLQGTAAVTGTQIGMATVGTNRGGTDQEPERDAKEIGFFAQSYNWNGETIIAYRGTDNGPFTLGLDQQYGYSLALGDVQSARTSRTASTLPHG